MNEEQNTINVYVASKTNHAKKWRDIRDNHWWGDNVQIISRWLDEPGIDRPSTEQDYSPEYLRDAWTRSLGDIDNCDILVVYAEPGDRDLRGALIETGVALGYGIPIIACGADTGDRHSVFGSWQFHPRVIRVLADFQIAATIHEAIKLI